MTSETTTPTFPDTPVPPRPATQIFVNLPVADLDAAKAFYEALGFAPHPAFTDENAAGIVLGENLFVMLLRPEFFTTFTHRPVATDGIEAINALSYASREEVDAVVDAALAAGGTETREPQDLGFMYSRGFADLDGHHWEAGHMDMTAAAEALAAAG
ncbi:hypothetical protein DNL40_12320 [Xylanimonas oleitrophica]|uniref:VOC domain-containing protein n=1 Tax=Xylanimonas oleitrophica TaxID=2607479 RepID=A0A2W5WNA0_9MICO|nr:VOC family protein [Xylanimonas oleitrophica]PZR52223.1 hypothetical protein DNL40_12320 [Xylanimonas oleitrophica]